MENLRTLAGELGFAARRLRRSPGYTTVVVLTIALGIGATTALFSTVHSVLLRPLPYPEPERLVRVFDTNRELSVERTGIASGNLVDWRKRSNGFAALAGCYVMGRTLRTDESVEVVRAAMVTEDFFSALRTPPALGRTFTPEEVARSLFNGAAAPVGTDLKMVISHGLWQSRFGGDPAVIGRTVSVDRKPWQIIGVMPANFRFPNSDVSVWLPWALRETAPRDQRYVQGIARLAPGESAAKAEANLQSVAAALAAEFPAPNKGWSVKLVPLQEVVTGKSSATLWLLLGSGVCVLLIGCANVAILQLIRASQFARETAVRVALGASQSRLLQQFGAEGFLLAASGGIAGLVFAAGALRWLRWAQPGQLPRIEEVELSLPSLAVAALLTLLAGMVTGLAPAWSARYDRLTQGLSEGGRSASGSRRAQRVRNLLVAAEVAVAVVLLVSASLLGRSLLRLHAVNPGFDYRNVLVLPIFLDNFEYTSGAKVRAYYDGLLNRLAALPGVVAVGGATILPASPLGPDFERPVWAEGQTPSPSEALRADVRMVMPDYFRTLGIRVMRGRTFEAQDSPESPRVIMVNEALAQRLWPGEEAVGKQIVVDYSTTGTYPYRVVGVVGNVRFYGLRSEPQPEVFLPHAQRSYLVMNIALRTAGDPRPLVPAVRAAVLAADPGQPPQSIKTLEELVGDTLAPDRLITGLIGAFSGTALLLAMLGIYGAVAYRAAQRTNEIGIRMALGAQPSQILRMILASGLGLTGMGAAVGLVLAMAAARLLQSQLFGVTPDDPLAYALAAAGIALVTVLACWTPARRAARVLPAEALRRL